MRNITIIVATLLLKLLLLVYFPVSNTFLHSLIFENVFREHLLFLQCLDTKIKGKYNRNAYK